MAQPITVKPELGAVPSQPLDRMILLGTGKFLENSDKTDLSDQTIYALKDVPSVATGPVIADVRDGGAVKVRTLVAGSQPKEGCPSGSCRTVASGPAPSWATEFGWLIDLPDDGERVNVDPQLQLGTLVVRVERPFGRHVHGGRFLVAQLPRLRHGLLRPWGDAAIWRAPSSRARSRSASTSSCCRAARS